MKSSPPPGTPNRLGNCVMAMVSPAPKRKPTSTLSLISFTSTLSRAAQATRQTAATAKAVSVAIAACIAGSPPAIPVTLAPTMSEMAEVGPIARWRDDPSSA